jgi:hypothetical protein
MVESIADKIMQATEALPFKEMMKSGRATSKVMEIFGTLGQSLGYRINCHARHYPAADNGEWMYDMIWFTEEPCAENIWFTGMPMVLESELQRGPKDGDTVDADFHKLVQARADVRVWISASPKNAKLHIENCKQQIQSFRGTEVGDCYIFAVYDWTAEKPLIERFVVPPQSK